MAWTTSQFSIDKYFLTEDSRRIVSLYRDEQTQQVYTTTSILDTSLDDLITYRKMYQSQNRRRMNRTWNNFTTSQKQAYLDMELDIYNSKRKSRQL